MSRKFLYICQVYWPYLAVGIPCRGSYSICVRYIGLYLAVGIPCRGSSSIYVRYIGLYLAVGIPCREVSLYVSGILASI